MEREWERKHWKNENTYRSNDPASERNTRDSKASFWFIFRLIAAHSVGLVSRPVPSRPVLFETLINLSLIKSLLILQALLAHLSSSAIVRVVFKLLFLHQITFCHINEPMNEWKNQRKEELNGFSTSFCWRSLFRSTWKNLLLSST